MYEQIRSETEKAINELIEKSHLKAGAQTARWWIARPFSGKAIVG